jgi:hypothetical protein
MKMTRAQKVEWLQRRREKAAFDGVTRYRGRMAGILAQTRKLFGKKVLLADLHTHSTYSDGGGPVAENAAWAKMAGLDFIFATDHCKVDAKRVVGKIPNAGWGEETGGGWYHIGILEPTPMHRYKPDKSLQEAWEEVEPLTDFRWIAHPFWAYEQPPEEQYQQVLSDMKPLGDMAMEIANGCAEIADGYFLTGAAGSRMVDELLCGGQRMTLLGVSDGHYIFDLGTAWTGVYADRCNSKKLIEALSAGNCFASEAPLLDVSLNGKPMGSTLKPKVGAALKLRARIAAAAGIAFVKVISGGKVIKEIWPKHEPVVDLSIDRKAARKDTYFRIETADANGRHAFSTPIYVRP